VRVADLLDCLELDEGVRERWLEQPLIDDMPRLLLELRTASCAARMIACIDTPTARFSRWACANVSAS
jgi:hypothetical protein